MHGNVCIHMYTNIQLRNTKRQTHHIHTHGNSDSSHWLEQFEKYNNLLLPPASYRSDRMPVQQLAHDFYQIWACPHQQYESQPTME